MWFQICLECRKNKTQGAKTIRNTDAKCLVLICSTFLFVIGLTALPPLLARSHSKKAFLIAIRLQSWTYKQLIGIYINKHKHEKVNIVLYMHVLLWEDKIRWIRHTDLTNVVYSLWVSIRGYLEVADKVFYWDRKGGRESPQACIYVMEVARTHKWGGGRLCTLHEWINELYQNPCSSKTNESRSE